VIIPAVCFLLQGNMKSILEKVCIKATTYLIKVKGKYIYN